MSGIPNTLDGKIWDAILADAQRRIPGYRVVAKESSLLMRVIGFFSASFAMVYTSTIGLTTFMPKALLAARKWWTLGHESVHAADYVANRAWWMVSYTFPTFLAAPALLGFGALGAIGGNLSYLWFLPFLAAIGFLWVPSPGRTHWERRGYLMSHVLCALKYGESYIQTADYIASVAGEFTGGAYLHMDPFVGTVEAWVRNDIGRALAIVRDQFEDPTYSPMVRLVRAVIKEAT